MKRGVLAALVVTVVAVAVALAFFWVRAPRATKIATGSPLPGVELPFAASDARSRLDAIHGEPLLLIFIETSSPGGRGFANAIELLHRRYSRRGLNLVAIALDEDREALRKFLAQEAITYIVLHDAGGRLTESTMGRSQPEDAYLVRADGKLERAFVTGEDWKDLRIQEAIEQLLPKRH